MKTSVAFGIALVLTGAGARVSAGIVPPTAVVAGKTQSQWAEVWWQTFLPIPPASNPITDATGAFSSSGDMGQVFFLAGSTSGDPVTRSVNVRSDQYLFVPITNAVTWEAFSAYGGGLDNLRHDNADLLGIDGSGVAATATLTASLDGSALPPAAGTNSLLDYRQVSSDLFDLFVPDPNIFGVPGGATVPAASDGWWLMIAPLSEGDHVLHLTARSESIGAYAGTIIGQDLAFNLHVSPVPEPSAAALVVVGLATAAFARLRSRRRA